MRIAITGATGLIGTAFCAELSRHGDQVVAFSRSPGKAKQLGATETVLWEASSGTPPGRALEGVDGVVNLAGESIAEGRWSAERKVAIRQSRIDGTRNLVEAIRRCDRPPKVLVSSSAVGYYGSREEEVLTEESDSGSGFLAEICQGWEKEALRATEAGIRVVLLRTGLVLSLEGGALPKMLPPFKMCVGGRLGNGRQWMSWIHIRDQVDAIRQAITSEQLEGPVNLTAPQPVTNGQFSRELARALNRPCLFPVPALALRILFGEMAQSLLLEGQRVLPRKLEALGYKFHFPELHGALADLID